MFFKTLAGLATEKLELTIGIKVEKGEVICTVVPVTKNTASKWPPFVITGAADTLDDEFEAQAEILKAGVTQIQDYAETIKTAVAVAAKKPATTTTTKTTTPAKTATATKKPEEKKEEPKKEEPTDEQSSLALFDE